MSSTRLDTLSPFGKSAVQLDADFVELARLSGQIERLDLQSDADLEYAVKLLNQFAQRGQAIAESMQEFSRLLQDAHKQSDAAVQGVGERAAQIHERRRRQNEIAEKLVLVEQDLKMAGASLAGFRKTGENGYSDEEKRQASAALEKLHGDLDAFIATAQAIKGEAVEHKFKTLERNAQSLIDTLYASRRKIQEAISSK